MQSDNRSIKIEKDTISSAIISGNGNKVVIYQYQLERQVAEEKTPHTEEIGPNPYKGLLAFQEEDGDRYFGREEQIEKLWNLFRTLHENITQPEPPLRLLPILGPSGCGKSSLARAGLIPELARHPLPGKSQARVAVLVPGTHPLEALATVLARVATNDLTPLEKTDKFERRLKRTADSGEYEGLRRIANVLPEIDVSPLVILVDQFEEVYSLCEDTEERQIFIENLIHAAGDRAGGVSVIITLRSDFLGETQRHPSLNQVIAEQGAIVPAMSEEELRRAITKPAELAEHPLDEAVVTLLLKDTQGREGALPLLQFALTRIWSGLKKGVEPIKTLEDTGGVGGALADEAQRIYLRLNDEEKQIARRVFLGLVQLGEGTSDTRRRASVSSLVSYKDQPEDVKRVIDRFADPGVRLVTLSSEPGNETATETAEVTHEALFANWEQMKEWLDSSHSDIRFQRRLESAVKVWDENGRPEGSLWRSPNLDRLREYSRRADDLNPLQLKFFHACEERIARNKSIVSIIFAILGLTIISSILYFDSKGKEKVLNLVKEKANLVTNSIERDLETHLQAAWQVNKRFSSLIRSGILVLDQKNREKVEKYFIDTVTSIQENNQYYLNERGIFWGDEKTGKVIGIIYPPNDKSNSERKKAKVWMSITQEKYEQLQQEGKKIKPECQQNISLDSNNVVGIYQISKSGDKEKYKTPFIRYDPRKRLWYTEAEKEQKWSSIYEFCESKEYGMSAVVQIHNNNELIGVLAVDVTLKEINEKLNQVTKEEAEAFLINKENELIALSSEKKHIFCPKKGFIIEDNNRYPCPKKGLIIDDNDHKLSFLYEEAQKAINSKHRDNEEPLSITIDKQDYFVMQKPLDDRLNLDDWSILVIIPKNQYSLNLKSFLREIFRANLPLNTKREQ